MCFGMDWCKCRANSATWLKLPESSIPIQTSGVWGACLGSPQIYNKSISFPGDFHEWLVEACWSTVKKLPTCGWHEAQISGVSKLAVVGGHGNPVLENLWKLKSLQMRILEMEAFQSLEATWFFSANWKFKSDKCKNQTYPSRRKSWKHGRLWRVLF